MVPDYYAMLGVDPGADRAALEAALARCQPAWSSGTRNPKTKHTYQSYLDQIPALRQALLGDPPARAAYDAELAAARRAVRPVEERVERNGWLVEICHHVHTGGHWSAGAYRPGTGCYAGERSLYVGPSEAECRATVEQFLLQQGMRG